MKKYLILFLIIVACASYGIVIENGDEFYTQEELDSASSQIDIVTGDVIECAKEKYPNKASQIDALDFTELTVRIMKPDGKTTSGFEFFFCTSSSTGKCSGEYSKSQQLIKVPPDLAAFPHEVGHFIHHKIFGNTSHDVNDISILCQKPMPCHLYAENRGSPVCK